MQRFSDLCQGAILLHGPRCQVVKFRLFLGNPIAAGTFDPDAVPLCHGTVQHRPFTIPPPDPQGSGMAQHQPGK